MSQAIYRPSGRVPLSIVPVLLAGLACAVPGALAYAWLGAHSPFFAGLLTIWLFAFWLACLAKGVCRLARVRNPLVMKECGFLLAAWAWAVHWVFWIVFASDPDMGGTAGAPIVVSLADLFADPIGAFDAALAATGWGEDIDADLVRGAGWAGELVVPAIVASLAGAAQANRPYCESSDRWARLTRLPQRFASDHLPRARKHLMAHPDQLPAALTPARSTKRYAVASLFRGREAAYLNVDLFESWGRGKRQGQRAGRLLQYCYLPARTADAIVARLQQHGAGQGVAVPLPFATRLRLWLGDQLGLPLQYGQPASDRENS